MSPKKRRAWIITVVPLGLIVVVALILTETQRRSTLRSRAGFLPGNPRRGGELFYERGCAQCHAVAGIGGKEAPDLARARRAPNDLDEIAGAMWNHAPEMWKKMASAGFEVLTITSGDFVDLMAFLFVAGYLEEEGDPARGEAILAKKKCRDCHTTGEEKRKIGPDLAQWSATVNPILWAQHLWNHAPAMEEAMQEKGIPWPQMSPTEVADLLAFLRANATTPRSRPPLPGDPWAGKALFRKHCQPCHRAEGQGGDVGPDLGAGSAPRTLSGLAASLWNHAPAMGEQMKKLAVARPSFSQQEMADLITYLFAIRYFENPGDRDAGAKVYSRSCRVCHGEGGAGDSGPSLRNLGDRCSACYMASRLWNHGPPMYEQMREKGLDWPRLDGNEMKDLTEYLRSL